MELILKNYQAAVDNYTQALNLFSEDNAEKGDLIYHLGEAQILAGDQTIGADNLKLGQTTIEKYQNTTDSFCYDVWLSGCLMKQALYLHDQIALDQAEKIIAANPRLILRRQQLDNLQKQLWPQSH